MAPGLVVLHQIGVPRPHVPRRPEELRVVGGALGRRQHDGGDRLAGSRAALVPRGADLLVADAGGHLGAAEQGLVIVVVEPGEQDHLVPLAAGGAELVAARTPPVEKGLDPGARQGHAGRAPEDDGRDAGSVGLAGAGDGELCSSEDLQPGCSRRRVGTAFTGRKDPGNLTSGALPGNEADSRKSRLHRQLLHFNRPGRERAEPARGAQGEGPPVSLSRSASARARS